MRKTGNLGRTGREELMLANCLGDRRVFLALALFNLNRFDDTEENYKKAIENAPSQPLARQVRQLLRDGAPVR
jgi:hypothetical protein